jgi:hypothetical protein
MNVIFNIILSEFYPLRKVDKMTTLSILFSHIRHVICIYMYRKNLVAKLFKSLNN